MTNLSLSANEMASMLGGAGLVTMGTDIYVGLGVVVLAVIIKMILGFFESKGIVVKTPPQG